jgi:DNA-binding XRE family transcriptional regulator/DNA-directed RNA polymerase subunit RPC12/RpoP
MRILEFFKRFPDEESCKKEFIQFRLNEGVICRRCKCSEHYWKKKREQWECKSCGFRTTIKSGTVMQNSKLSYTYWFIAMHLLSCTKKSFSAKEIQRELGHNRYQPIWEMAHKIRSVMGLRDDRYILSNEIELDDGFFETVDISRNINEPLKRGRGSQRQSTVLVMAESREVELTELNKKYKHHKKFGFLKMKVITGGFSEKLFTPVVKKNVGVNTTIKSDGSTSYSELNSKFDHQPKTIPKKEAGKILPWVHTAISNAKRMLLDVHHRIDDDFLQNYLNAYVFKLNRRYFKNIFDRVLIAAVNHQWNYLGETCG